MIGNCATNDPVSKPVASRWVDAVALTAIVALAIALRCWLLNDRGLWFDEAFSWRLTRFQWGEMLHRATLDNNPPFYYLLLKLWTACFGASAGAMRSLSVLAGAAACVAVYLFVCEAYSPRHARQSFSPRPVRWTAFVAAALTGTSVLQIRWSWEVRMYSAGACLAALSSWLLVRALHSQRLAPWLAYAAAALAFGYTHTFALFSLAAQAVYTAGYLLLTAHDRIRGASTATSGSGGTGPSGMLPPGTRLRVTGHLSGPCLAAAVIVAGYAPWLGVLARQHEQVRESFWIGPFTWASVPKAAIQMFIDPMEAAVDNGEGWICAGLCAVVLAGLAFRPLPADCLLCLSVAFPITAAALLSACGTPIFEARYLLFSQVFILCGFARLACDVPRPPERAIAAGILVAGFLVALCDFMSRLPAEQSSGLRRAAEHIVGRGKRDDLVIVCSPYFYLPMRYELGEERDCGLLSPGRPLLHYEGMAALSDNDFISPLKPSVGRRNRVWVVEGGRRATACTMPPQTWRQASVRSFFEEYGIGGSIRLVEYEAANGASSALVTSRRRDVGPTVTLFVDRCVMRSRCVRFTREIAGTSELMVINRGSHEEIDTVPGFPLANKLSGNVVMKKHARVCTGCSTGCSIWTEENQDHVYRLQPRENPLVADRSAIAICSSDTRIGPLAEYCPSRTPSASSARSSKTTSAAPTPAATTRPNPCFRSTRNAVRKATSSRSPPGGRRRATMDSRRLPCFQHRRDGRGRLLKVPHRE